jgi:hypothetical protein
MIMIRDMLELELDVDGDGDSVYLTNREEGGPGT